MNHLQSTEEILHKVFHNHSEAENIANNETKAAKSYKVRQRFLLASHDLQKHLNENHKICKTWVPWHRE